MGIKNIFSGPAKIIGKGLRGAQRLTSSIPGVGGLSQAVGLESLQKQGAQFFDPQQPDAPTAQEPETTALDDAEEDRRRRRRQTFAAGERGAGLVPQSKLSRQALLGSL